MRLGIVGGVAAVVIVLLALILGYSALFTVYQTQQALVVRLGEPVRVVTQPGLHWKMPLIDSVIYVDKRILDLENPAQEVIASDQKRLVVDAFARYKIVNPLRFYQTVGTVEGANSRLSTLLNSALRRVLGEATLDPGRARSARALMNRVREQLDTRGAGVRHLRSSTSASAAPICRNRTVRRSISACRPSASAKRPSSARRAASAPRKSAPRPIAR